MKVLTERLLSGRGIGRAIALALAQSGAHVALLSRTKSDLDEVADIIKTKFNRKALVFAVDATDNSAVAKAFAQTEIELGKLDIVVPTPRLHSGVHLHMLISMTGGGSWS